MKQTKSGFTIVELLIVIVIIAILATISVVAYNGLQDRARKSSQAAAATQIERQIMTSALQRGGESISISGTLLAYQDGTGSATLIRPITGNVGITMYGVFDVVNMNGNYVSPLALTVDSSSTNKFRFQTGASSTSGLGVRIDASNQPNLGSTQGNIRNTPGRVVGWMQSSSTANSFSYAISQAAQHGSGSIGAHGGWDFSGVAVSNSTGISGVAALVFSAEHDATTRAQIMNWLADKYSVGATY